MVALLITRENAEHLRQLLLDQPHNEQWSNQVLDQLEQAMKVTPLFSVKVREAVT